MLERVQFIIVWETIKEQQLIDLYNGMDSACKEFGGYLVGGDIVKSKNIS